MGILIIFAFISGIVTILSPCILPILPVVLAGGAGGGKSRPLGIVTGFTVSFTFFTLSLTAIVQAFGIPADALRIVAVVVIMLFGLVLIIPKLQFLFEMVAVRIANLGNKKFSLNKIPDREKKGIGSFASGLPVGFSLGLVWTPCVGPIMASIVSLALTEKLDAGAFLITFAYAAGTAIPMFVIMLGGNALLKRVPFLVRNTGRIQKIFGVLMIIVGISISLGWDRRFQSAVLDLFPGYGTGLTTIENTGMVRDELKKRESLPGQNSPEAFSYENQPENGKLGDYGPAPPIVTAGRWINTEKADVASDAAFSVPGEPPPLSMDNLAGKVVLVDFWTYSCVNCVRTIPYLKSWYKTYKDKGFVIIGVHTPEFEFEKNPENVSRAVRDLGVDWPVVLDNEYRQWRAYNNHYWPAHYFIDAQGYVRYFSFGEGHYDISEKVIQSLLKEAGYDIKTEIKVDNPRFDTQTPEIYLGYGRTMNFISDESITRDTTAVYTSSKDPGNGEWSVNGDWKITQQYIVPDKSGSVHLGFNARDVYMVAEPEEHGSTIYLRLDNGKTADTNDTKNNVLIPSGSRLYHLINLDKPGAHVLDLEIKGKIRLFAFTFG